METFEDTSQQTKSVNHPINDCTILDPLESDQPNDQLVITTRRAISRIALVAVETAGRFEREHISYDPMSWMLAPRDIFDGACAIDACLELQHCLRSVLMHGLGLGLDCDRGDIDELVIDYEIDECRPEPCARSHISLAHENQHAKLKNIRKPQSYADLRLWTATMNYTSETLHLNAFHASLAAEASNILDRLRGRYGEDIARTADIRRGFHSAMPVTLALVQEPIAELIRQVEAEPGLADPVRFAVNIEQRIQP